MSQHGTYMAQGLAGITSLIQWKRLTPFVRHALSLKTERTNGDLAAAVQLLMREQTPEHCREVARRILENEDVRFIEHVLGDQFVEAERDARAKDL